MAGQQPLHERVVAGVGRIPDGVVLTSSIRHGSRIPLFLVSLASYSVSTLYSSFYPLAEIIHKTYCKLMIGSQSHNTSIISSVVNTT